ncbi:kinase-like domain-containing protein [Fusarium oxysporum]|nr:kinase-like domain-containing protein [Fusarium oxysporum]
MDSGRNDKEAGCFAITFERKYYQRGKAFIKRTLRPLEFRVAFNGSLHVPQLNKERLMNEAESLRFIRSETNIPVPAVYCDFEDDEAYYLITEYIDGDNMADLSEEGKAIVQEELKGYLATLRTLKSSRLGGPSGIVIPPYRVMQRAQSNNWTLSPSEQSEYVFCHNDLSQHNIIVDPRTFKINAIIDWEYAGFYPPYFESPFYTRPGPSSAVEGEVDDSGKLLEFLNSQNIQSK